MISRPVESKQNLYVWIWSLYILPEGIEPPLQEPESCVISITLWQHALEL